MVYRLRAYSNAMLHAGVDGDRVFDLPIVFTGNRQECEDYASRCGFKWKPRAGHLFGGYWISPECDLIPT